jgi:hypothetical protein
MKNTMPLEKLFEVMWDIAAISMEDGELCYPKLHSVTGDESNVFMSLEWHDVDAENGYFKTYNAYFEEGKNSNVTYYNNQVDLIDSDGQELTIYLLGDYQIK